MPADQAEPPLETITLPRTGEGPLQFTGRLIAEAATPPPEFTKAKKDSIRWHELRLYQTAKGKYVIAIGFRSKMEMELPIDTVLVMETLDAVATALGDDDAYDPLEFIQGFPDRPQFAERQRKLENRITDDYDNRVSKLLAQAGYVETLE